MAQGRGWPKAGNSSLTQTSLQYEQANDWRNNFAGTSARYKQTNNWHDNVSPIIGLQSAF